MTSNGVKKAKDACVRSAMKRKNEGQQCTSRANIPNRPGAYAEIEFERPQRNKNPTDDVSVGQHQGHRSVEAGGRRYSGAEVFRRRALRPAEAGWEPHSSCCGVRVREAARKACRKKRIIGEMSSKQVFNRLSGTWTYWGWKGGYFDAEGDARAFFDELCFMLATQKCAPNSPQWFNTGLHWAYGIDGPGQGHFYVDHETGKLTKSTI